MKLKAREVSRNEDTQVRLGKIIGVCAEGIKELKSNVTIVIYESLFANN